MADMLPQIPKLKNQETSTETQNLVNLRKRKSELEDTISRIEQYVIEQGGNLKNSPLFNVKSNQLKKIESQIKDIEGIMSVDAEISGGFADNKDFENLDVDMTSEKSLDELLMRVDNQDLFGSEEFKKLVDSLPGEYDKNEFFNLNNDENPDTLESIIKPNK